MNRNKSYVDPRDFGVVGDGVTDDTLAWQAALDYSASTGLPLVVTGMNLNVDSERIVTPVWTLQDEPRQRTEIISVPKDGDDYPENEFVCSCGRGPYRLWWNGGELDNLKCECGLWYYGRHERTIIKVDRKGPYDED